MGGYINVTSNLLHFHELWDWRNCKVFQPFPPFPSKTMRNHRGSSRIWLIPLMAACPCPRYHGTIPKNPTPNNPTCEKTSKSLVSFVILTHVACNFSPSGSRFFLPDFHGGWPLKHIPSSWKLYRPYVFFFGLCTEDIFDSIKVGLNLY